MRIITKKVQVVFLRMFFIKRLSSENANNGGG